MKRQVRADRGIFPTVWSVFLRDFQIHFNTLFTIAIIIFCFTGFVIVPCNGQYVPLWLQQSYRLLSIPRFIPNQVILYFEFGTNPVQILALYTLYGLKEISSSPLSGANPRCANATSR